MPQALDLVFYQKFLPFEFYDLQIVDPAMGQAVCYFFFKRLVPFFEFRKVRLHRHAVCLLNQWLSTK